MSPAPLEHLADSILYLSALLADQPRSIDRYIDYFGGVMQRADSRELPSARRLAG